MQSIAKYSNVQAPGRFIFRIDEWIQPGGCLEIDFNTESEACFLKENLIIVSNFIAVSKRKSSNLAKKRNYARWSGG
jgi:hypothetical protein